MAISADTCTIAETFKAPVAKKNGDIAFGDLIFIQKNNPDGTATPLKGGAVRLSVKTGSHPLDTEDARENQRAEIRESSEKYLKPGVPVEYRWKMRGHVVPSNNTRLMVAQFKVPFGNNDGPSPVFSIRVLNGRYYASIEQSYLQGSPAMKVSEKGVCKEGVPATINDPGGGQARLMFAQDEKGLSKDWLKRFDLCSPNIKIENFAPLPKLSKKWVQFGFSITSGPQGRMELYANGKLVARASGPFGDLQQTNKQYFKFGPYRDIDSAPASFDYKDFERVCETPLTKK